MVYLQNNKVFMSGGLDKRIYVWNIPRKRIAFQVEIGDMITAGAFVSDKGEYLVVGTDTGKLLFCETEVRPPFDPCHYDHFYSDLFILPLLCSSSTEGGHNKRAHEPGCGGLDLATAHNRTHSHLVA
jgi:hypothetical protein